MESEAVLSLPVEGRWLFVIIILSADDLGLFEATEFKLARRADVNRELAGKLMAMLVDADLVRLYEVEGKRFGFIPKFRQRVQIKTLKHPLPPRGMYADDLDASKKFNELAIKTTVGAPVGSGCPSDGQPSEAEVEEEAELKVSESQNSSSSSPPRRRRKAANRVAQCPFDLIAKVYNELLPELPEVRVMGKARRKVVGELWTFVMTTSRNGVPRASNADEGIAWFREYFERARHNDWIMGRVARGPGHENWQPDIDYVCSEKGMKRVIEQTREPA